MVDCDIFQEPHDPSDAVRNNTSRMEENIHPIRNG
jgi:hypothetical protein